MNMEVTCVSWYDSEGKRHIEWDVFDPQTLVDNLISEGIDPETIDVYDKDVS